MEEDPPVRRPRPRRPSPASRRSRRPSPPNLTTRHAQRDLGFALLQRVRETADPSLYAPAETAFDAARRLLPTTPWSLPGSAVSSSESTNSADALTTGRMAVELSPNLASARAVVVDALVELGRYDEASDAADEMLAVGSDLSTLSRVSYLAELHGKLDVAVTAMKLAAKTPGLAPENIAFVDSLLGNLLVYSGDTAGGRRCIRPRPRRSSRPTPRRWRARAASRSGTADSTTRSRCSSGPPTSCPLPEYVIALADAQSAAGLDRCGRTERQARSGRDPAVPGDRRHRRPRSRAVRG